MVRTPSTSSLPPRTRKRARRRSSSSRSLLTRSLLFALACAAPGRGAASEVTPEIIVEISPAADELLNARVTRRLIQLELAELKLGPRPTQAEQDRSALYYRLLVADGELRIELWERGEFFGTRRVSTAHGDKKLLARHVALATAELAQRLSRAYSQRTERLGREQREADQAEKERVERARRERWALGSRVESAWLPRTEAWLVGPRLGFQLNHPRQGRLELSSAWMFGTPGTLSDAKNLEWLEIEVAPALRLDDQHLAAGFDLAAAVVMLGGPVSVDATPEQRQTWSARAGLHLDYQPPLSRDVRLQLGADVAVLLRSVRVQPAQGSANDLGGLWLGVNLGVVIGS